MFPALRAKCSPTPLLAGLQIIRAASRKCVLAAPKPPPNPKSTSCRRTPIEVSSMNACIWRAAAKRFGQEENSSGRPAGASHGSTLDQLRDTSPPRKSGSRYLARGCATASAAGREQLTRRRNGLDPARTEASAWRTPSRKSRQIVPEWHMSRRSCSVFVSEKRRPQGFADRGWLRKPPGHQKESRISSRREASENPCGGRAGSSNG